jgi:DNA-directed RNA polymerase specialized sigma24 family protein
MPANDPLTAPERSSDRPADVVRAAFRDLHGRRLHGFALLLTLGDRPEAARLASEALATGVARIEELRHPERAAAWLRRRVVKRARISRTTRNDRGVVRELGAEEAVIAAIAPLDRLERGALIASHVERLDRRDVASIVGRDGPALNRLLRRARQRYLRAYAGAAVAEPAERGEGPIVTRLNDLARRAMT